MAYIKKCAGTQAWSAIHCADEVPPSGHTEEPWIASPNQVTWTNERHRCYNPPAFTRQGEVEESTLPRHKRPIPYLRALLGLFPAKDVVVYTPAEVAEWANVPNAWRLVTGRLLSPPIPVALKCHLT